MMNRHASTAAALTCLALFCTHANEVMADGPSHRALLLQIDDDDDDGYRGLHRGMVRQYGGARSGQRWGYRDDDDDDDGRRVRRGRGDDRRGGWRHRDDDDD